MNKGFFSIGLLCMMLLCLPFSYAQTGKKILQWKSVQTQPFGSDSVHFFYFDGAIYDAVNKTLPYYYTREKINFPNSLINVEIQNKIFEEISEGDINKVENLSGIEDDILVETNISIQEKQPYANIRFIPIRKNNITGRYEKLVSFSLSISYKETGEKFSATKKQNWADNSVLKSGKWYKIAVKQDGIYKLTYDQLTGMGLNITDPRNIRVYGNGGGMLPETAGNFRYDDLVENAIYVEGESDGSFDQGDYVLFYGESPNNWYYDISGDKLFHHRQNIYADFNYYYINADLGLGKRVTTQSSTNDLSNQTVTTFNDYSFHELDSVNVLKTGKEWYGERFDVVTEYNFPFSFPDIQTSDSALLKVNVLTKAIINTTFKVYCSNQEMGINVPGVPPKDEYTFGNSATGKLWFFPNSSNLNVIVKYNKGTSSSSTGFLDYIELSVRRNLAFSSDQMIFRDKKCIGPGNVSDFILSNASSNIRLWDITNPHEAKIQEYSLNGSNLTFRIHTDTLRQFIAFNGNSYFTPTLVGSVENQNLHGLSNISFIIVTPSAFISEANRLADFHRNADNMSVVVATTDQVYNEFSSGKQDIAAIRNFAKMFYDRSTNNENMPKNILLFGDASYDYKNRVTENTNFVPAFESTTSLNSDYSIVTDDFFGVLDDNEGYESHGDLDIGVGRLPVKTLAEAKEGVDKILRYGSKTNLVTTGNSISNFADWRNTVCFVADDGDKGGQIFMIDADNLSGKIINKHKNYNVDKIYLDAYQQSITPGGTRYPDVNKAINNRVFKGALIINYIGHSGEVGWALERIIEMIDINNWKNTYNMPLFISASCSFAHYDDPSWTSAGERVFLNPNGGGVALIATSRLANDGDNQSFLQNFYDTAFTKANNQYYTMGELVKIAKVRSNSTTAMNKFVLLGDPALKLSYPQYKVFTTKINNDSINSALDTLKALSKVTISGFVADEAGNKLTNYNGKLYPTIYDKFSNIRTLGNDSDPYEFTIRKNILYKGKASVKNGDFKFTFVVPKDINYTFGNGKISYYAENGNSDAAGYFENFIIGGSDTTSISDNDGPSISLYINNTGFKSGGITDENPLLLSFLADSLGINTVGNGVGHDIIAVLDNDNENPYILNDYYQADLDSYQRGSISYPFINLDEGLHNLKLRAWDIYNNSSEANIEFIVVKSSKIALENIINYPNPFKEKTTFRFEHNQSDTDLDVFIQIFSITGNLVKTIDTKIQTTGYIADQINWDGSADNGQKIGSGIYIYKIKIGNKNTGYIEKSEKLVVIK